MVYIGCRGSLGRWDSLGRLEDPPMPALEDA